MISFNNNFFLNQKYHLHPLASERLKCQLIMSTEITKNLVRTFSN